MIFRGGLRLLLLVSTLTLSGTAFAVEIDLVCSTRSTYVHVYSDASKVYFNYQDKHGFINFPLYEGVVTPVTLEQLATAAKDLRHFNGNVTAAWDRKLCSFDPARELLIDCDGRGEIVQPAGGHMYSTRMTTSLERVERLDMTYDRVKFSWGLNTVEGGFRNHFTALPFDRRGCVVKYPASAASPSL